MQFISTLISLVIMLALAGISAAFTVVTAGIAGAIWLTVVIGSFVLAGIAVLWNKITGSDDDDPMQDMHL